MTYLPNYKSPFIFANFNGTSGDVDVITHECGHAFQGYLMRRRDSGICRYHHGDSGDPLYVHGIFHLWLDGDVLRRPEG